jgi:hypothetical protein
MKLAELFTELTLKDAKFQKGLSTTQKRLEATARRMQAVSRTARRMFVVTSAAIGGMIALAARQERAENDLAAAFRAHGDAVEDLLPDMKQFAAGVQRATTMGDENVLSLAAQIRNLGVMPSQLKQATRGAIGLAKALNLDSNASARYTALALKGEFTILQRYVPALRTATSESEKLAIVTGLMERGFQQAQQETQDIGGQLSQLKNELGDLGEELGQIFVPMVRDMIGGIRDVVPGIRRWADNNRELIPTVTKLAALVAGLAIVGGPLANMALLLNQIGGAAVTAKAGIIGLAAGVGLLTFKITQFGAEASGLTDVLAEMMLAATGRTFAPKTLAAHPRVKEIQSRLPGRPFTTPITTQGQGFGKDFTGRLIGGIQGLISRPPTITRGLSRAAETLRELNRTRDVRSEIERVNAAEIRRNGTLRDRLQLLNREERQRREIAESERERTAIGQLFGRRREIAIQDALRAAESEVSALLVEPTARRGRAPSFAGVGEFSRQMQLLIAAGEDEEDLKLQREQLKTLGEAVGKLDDILEVNAEFSALKN